MVPGSHGIAINTNARLLEEGRLLHELPMLPDLQCAWLLLAMCASPRAHAPRPQHTGLFGPMPCLFCAPAGLTPRPAALMSSPTVLPRPSRAFVLLRRLAARLTALTGQAARLGVTCLTTYAPHNATCLGLARGARAGSITVHALALPTSAKPSCCPLCQPPPRPCSAHNRGRTLQPGSAPPRARLALLCRPTACS